MVRTASIANIWRQWERFTTVGIRIRNRRITAVQTIVVWVAVLSVFYVCGHFLTPSAAIDEDFPEYSATFWRDRRFIFAVSPGRSASKHLRNLLDLVEDMRAYHEPMPTMTGPVLQDVMIKGKRMETFRTRADQKLSAIRTELIGSPKSVVYAETSHMFVKTFADVILHELGDLANITVIFLRRPLSRIVLSQLRLGWFTPGHSGYGAWYYDVCEVCPSEQVLGLTSNNLTDIVDKAIAYNVDVWKRGENLRETIDDMHAKNQWRNVKMVDVDVANLVGETNIVSFLENLGLLVDRTRLQLLGVEDDNERQLKKDRVSTNLTAEDIARRVDMFKRELPTINNIINSAT